MNRLGISNCLEAGGRSQFKLQIVDRELSNVYDLEGYMKRRTVIYTKINHISSFKCKPNFDFFKMILKNVFILLY